LIKVGGIAEEEGQKADDRTDDIAFRTAEGDLAAVVVSDGKKFSLSSRGDNAIIKKIFTRRR